MFDIGTGEVGTVSVFTTHNRGSTPEELADRAMLKIIQIGDNAPAELRVQAEAFRDSIRQVFVYYMYEAIQSHNTTLANKLTQAGHPELVPMLKA